MVVQQRAMHKRVLALAVPNILSNISVPLLGAVDTALAGNLSEAHFLEAVGTGGAIFGFFYWGLGFLRMGTTGMTAQAYGERDDVKQLHILVRALLVALSIGAFVFLFAELIADVGYAIFEVPPLSEQYGRDYLLIRCLAAPATLSIMVMQGWFLGMQNSRIPLYLTLIVNVVNIGFSVLFVHELGMQSNGIAWGTVIAQYTGLAFAVAMYLRYFVTDAKVSRERVLNIEELKRFFSVNSDIFVRSMCLEATYQFMLIQGAKLGEFTLSANLILLNFWTFIAYGIDGFAYATESLTGRYIGERNRPKLYNAIKVCFVWSMASAGVMALVLWLGMDEFLALFTNNNDVLLTASEVAVWTIVAPLISAVCFTWDGVFVGATATKQMRNSMIFSTIFVYFPVYYFTHDALGNHALWLAMTAFMVSRGATMSAYAKPTIYTPKVLQTQ